jgi:hypothetical protein
MTGRWRFAGAELQWVRKKYFESDLKRGLPSPEGRMYEDFESELELIEELRWHL